MGSSLLSLLLLAFSSTLLLAPLIVDARPATQLDKNSLALSPVDSHFCGYHQFYYLKKKACLDKGGEWDHPSPPKGVWCPKKWSWSKRYNGCVPDQLEDDKPGPNCDRGGKWNHKNDCCEEHPSGPKPSGHYGGGGGGHHNRRDQAFSVQMATPLDGRIDPSRCPSGLTACPINLGGLDDWECLNPMEELSSCGGCVSLGVGQDCNLINKARTVSCDVGVCKVHSCRRGFQPNENQTACVAFLTIVKQNI